MHGRDAEEDDGTTGDRDPEVSIVVVAFQARDDVVACLGSIRSCVEISHEVVVVDDGSDDGTADAVRERFPEVTLIAKPQNEGLVAGRNDAIEVIRGRLVLMLDADTKVRPGAVEALAKVLDEDPEVGLVGPKLIGPSGELQPSCRRWSPFWMPLIRRGPIALVWREPRAQEHHLMLDWDHSHQREVVWVSGAAQMWRADLPSLIGGYDRRVSSYGGEDKDWCLRVWKADLKVVYAPQAEIDHIWQHVIRKQARWSGKAFRALRDWYYLQWKHRKLRKDPRLAQALK